MPNNRIINTYKVSDLLSALKADNTICVLYGAGTGVSSFSKLAYASLTYWKLLPNFFIDDDPKRQDNELYGLKIHSPETLINYKSKKIVLILATNYIDGLLKSLATLNLDNIVIYSLTGLLRETPKPAFDGYMNFQEVQRRLHIHNTKILMLEARTVGKLYLSALDIQVTEKCTMKCKDCSNLMQYYDKPVHADTNLLLNNIEIILDSIESLGEARILGGEPFLNFELPAILRALIDSSKVQRIQIYTNATFVPKLETLSSLAHSKVQVEITDYDYLSRNHKEVINAFQANSINFISHKPQNWTDSARIVKNDKSHNELTEMFQRCCVNDVLSLLHGKLYHCPFSANVHNLKAIPDFKWDYLDLKDFKNSTELSQALLDFYFGRPYQSACKFCLGRDFTQPLVEPALQIKNPIPIPIYPV